MMHKINLHNAAFISYGLAICLEVHQHLWYSGGGEANVYKGQVGEAEVHESVQLRIPNYPQNSQQVLKHIASYTERKIPYI
jgi:hypothetical protein